MQKRSVEPGLIQAFRVYVVLRVVYLVVLPMTRFNPVGRRFFSADHSPMDITYLALAEIVFLVFFFFWPNLQQKIGRLYLPIAIVITSVMVLLNQYLFSPNRFYFQNLPFLYLILLFVAWQYPFRKVLLYTFATFIADILLYLIIPLPQVLGPPFHEMERFLNFGSIFTRLFAFLILGFFVTRLMSAQRKQRQEIADAHGKLVQHASTLEQLTISWERNRLARELHDTVAHTLSALSVQLEALSTMWSKIPKKARQMIEQMQTTTRDGLEETRRAMIALRASPLEELGLVIAIRTLAEDISARYALTLTLDLAENIEELNPEIEQSFYRIAQEALDNITQHANAKRIRIQLQQLSKKLSLHIQDDGDGFDPESDIQTKRLGIRGMQERAGIIGAELKVESSPGNGTIIQLTWVGGL